MRGTRSSELGIALPTSAKVFWLSRFMTEQPTVNPLRTFGAGNGLVGVTLADATVTAVAMKSFGTSVMRTFVRTVSGMPAQMTLGEKYPILTSSYEFGVTNPIANGNYVPFPSFQFENLGLTMKVTPYVHDTEEMSIELEAEFKLLSGAQINGIPILSQRKFNSRVRMRDGQWALLGGLGLDSSSINSSGIPGLMGIPGLGQLFRTTTREGNMGEVLVLMKPRLLSAGTDLAPGAIFLGPEGRPAMVF
jgi:type II secretory pathway component GspD/PulD (secretin)